jgi:hypothetical protein
LIQINAGRPAGLASSIHGCALAMAKPFLYRCPVTGLNVQGMTTDREREADNAGPARPEMVNCPACGGVHLVDPAKAPRPPANPK